MFYFGGSIHKYFDQSNKKDYNLYFEVLRFQEDQLQLRSYAQILYVSQITETIKISTLNSGNSNLKFFHVHSFGPGKDLGERGANVFFLFSGRPNRSSNFSQNANGRLYFANKVCAWKNMVKKDIFSHPMKISTKKLQFFVARSPWNWYLLKPKPFFLKTFRVGSPKRFIIIIIRGGFRGRGWWDADAIFSGIRPPADPTF